MATEPARNVPIAAQLYGEIEKIVAQSVRFNSVADFVNHVLQEMLREDAADWSERDEAELRSRLRDLGYL